MSKLFAAFLLLSVLYICNASAQRKTDLEAAKLRGMVKSVRVESATLTNEDGKTIESERRPRDVTVYDGQGNRIESQSFRHDGIVLSRTSYERDAQEHVILTTYDGDGKFVRKAVQLVNAEGKFVGFIFFGANGELKQRSVEMRAANGRLAQEAVYDGNGKLLYRNIFSYDVNGTQTEYAVYDASGNLTQKTVWLTGGGFHTVRYDERGNISFESTNQASTIEETDVQGNWTKQRESQKNTQNGYTREFVVVTYRTIEYYPPKKK
ncbi:MAG TPA: hypothetical protein VF656_04100 [Pyrinomonadaceae bacterium]|jgi:YD repeat-containing protein